MIKPSFSTEQLLARFNEIITDNLGLHFPPERRRDLEKGVERASLQIGFADTDSCLRELTSRPLTRGETQTLARELTVGETYFFRDYPNLEALAQHVLSEEWRHIWCAGCSSGEEALSIAIILDRIVSPASRNVEIFATDINPAVLQKAAGGVFSDWSFRNAPLWLKRDYFRQKDRHHFEILPRIKNKVTFGTLNLATDPYPQTDVVVCRNVLMYFSPEQARKVVRNIHQAIRGPGFLLVSPTEVSSEIATVFTPERSGPVTLYRKVEQPLVAAERYSPFSRAVDPPPAPAMARGHAAGVRLPRAVKVEAPAQTSVDRARGSLDLAREYADAGRLKKALKMVGQAVVDYKLDPGVHYLHAAILEESGLLIDAVAALKRVVYLKPDFALAHFSLGRLESRTGSMKSARRHFRAAMSVLSGLPADMTVPYSEEISVGRLRELVQAALNGVMNDGRRQTGS